MTLGANEPEVGSLAHSAAPADFTFHLSCDLNLQASDRPARRPWITLPPPAAAAACLPPARR